METASSCVAASGGGGGGGGGGRLLELLLVDLTLFGPTVLEPDLHLKHRRLWINRGSSARRVEAAAAVPGAPTG